MKKWQCSVCKYIHTGDAPPEKCPVCGVGSDKFVLIDAGDSVKNDTQPPAKEPAKTMDSPTPTDPGSLESRKSDLVTSPENLYERILGLVVKHHAHPVSVHIPNGIVPAAVILFILAWAFNIDFFTKVGVINLIFVILALPFVLFSGVIEWTQKYNQALTTIFIIKILTASITTASCLISIVWYLINPDVLSSPKAWVFIVLNIFMLGCAGIAGHIGGKLVFKD